MVEAHTVPLCCDACKTPIPSEYYHASFAIPCVNCGASLETTVFPTLFRPPETGALPEALALESEASCFYHATKKATTVCENCGRFLCALCDVTIADRHLCTACIESGQKKDQIPHLKKNRTLYDDMAVSIAVLPMLIFYFTIITAPIALFIAIRYWNAPSSIIPRTKIKFVIAIVFASLQISGWVAALLFVIFSK